MIRTSPFRRLTQSRSAADGSARRSSRWVSSRTSGASIRSAAGPQPHDPPHREAFRAAHGVRVEHRGVAVRGHAVDQIVGQVHEPGRAQADDELRVIEGVVEQRGELRAEAARANDVLVERQVDDPRPRALDAALLGVAERAGRRQRELGQIVELRAAAARVRIAGDVGPPALRRTVRRRPACGRCWRDRCRRCRRR